MKALESLCESSKDAGLVLSALRSVLTLDRASRSQQTHGYETTAAALAPFYSLLGSPVQAANTPL